MATSSTGFWSAYAALNAGRAAEALNILAAWPDPDAPLAQCLAGVARGMLHAAAGEASQARRCFVEALAIGAPLPAVLRECGRYLAAAGDHERAFECFTLLQFWQTGFYFEFWRSLPAAQRVRYVPLVARTMLHGPHPRLYELQPLKADLVLQLGDEAAAIVFSQFEREGATSPPAGNQPVGDAQLRHACDRLDAGAPEEVLQALDESAQHEGMLARAIVAAARGMLCEARGEDVQARAHFDQAFAVGVPLAGLLRQCGRHFKRRCNYARAYECFTLLQQLAPGAILEFVQELPAAELRRYAPISAGRLLRGTRPNFYGVQPVKTALVDAFGVTGAALVFSQLVLPDDHWRLRELPVASLHDYAQDHALAFREIAAPRDVFMAGPEVHGAPAPSGIGGRSRSFFICVLPDVVVSSKSNLLIAGDRALMDYQGGELALVPIDLDVDPIVIAAAGPALTLLERTEVARAPPLAEAFSLVGVHSYNYGHWIFEFMFRLWASLEHAKFSEVALLVDEKMPPQHRQMLSFFAGDHNVITLAPGHSITVQRLWCGSTPGYWPAGDKAGTGSAPEAWRSDVPVLVALLRRLEPRLATADREGGPRRLFLARKDNLARRMLNGSEVETWFCARGFVAIDFGQMTFVEQLALIRGAEIVVGPDGSAFFNALFARPGLRIGMLSQPFIEGYEWFAQMFEALGHHLLILPGELERLHPRYRDMSDFHIEVGRLEGFLDKLCEIS